MKRHVNSNVSMSGFTLIEMVVVLVLLGIVGAVIVPRFLEPPAFNDVMAKDGMLATIRAAQQASLGRSLVTFEIDSSAGGDRWVMAAKAGGVSLRTFDVSKTNVTLTTGSAAASTDTCAIVAGAFSTVLNANFALAFDEKGNLESFTNGATVPVDSSFNGVRICVNANVPASVCVSPAGYAYAGNCDG